MSISLIDRSIEKTRYNLRIKKWGWTFFVMLAKTQTLEGVSSLLSDGRHIVMWDLENCTLEQAEETLRAVQRQYNLSHIFLVGDTEGSYRAWCFSKVDLKTLLHILLDTEYLDYVFFYYTVKRRKATLRTDSKRGRPPQQLVSVLESYPASIPTELEQVIYDTGLEKRGRNIMLGDRDG